MKIEVYSAKKIIRSKKIERWHLSIISLLVVALPIAIFSSVSLAADGVKQIDYSDAEKAIKQAKRFARDGNEAEAQSLLRSVIAKYPLNSRAKLELAVLKTKSRELLPAYNLCAEVLRTEPKNAFALAVMGTVYLTAGNFTDAKRFLKTAIFHDRLQGLAWASLGLLDFYENRIDESILNLNEALIHDPKEPYFAFALAQVSSRAEKYTDAANAYEMFLRNSGNSDKERRDRIRGLIKFLRYLGQKPSLYAVGGDREAVLKMQISNNRPVVQVRFSKEGEPLNFVLDTGSGISVLSYETAKRMGIKSVTKGGVARAIGGDGKFDIVYGFINKIYLGGVQVKNVPVYLREFHQTSEKIDGYIGLSLISKYLTTIDYGDGTFTLKRKDKENERYQTSEMESDTNTMSLRLTTSGFLSGEVKLDGIESPLNFIVDTGASVSVIDSELAVSAQIAPHTDGETMRVIGAAGITENVPSFILPKVSFGNYTRDKLKAIALNLDLINETSGFEQAGILGGNFLRNYRLTFDFKRSKVTFVPHGK